MLCKQLHVSQGAHRAVLNEGLLGSRYRRAVVSPLRQLGLHSTNGDAYEMIISALYAAEEHITAIKRLSICRIWDQGCRHQSDSRLGN